MKEPSKRVLLTGGSGFIGKNLLEHPAFSRWQVFAPRHSELDLMDESAVQTYLQQNGIQLVVHSAVKPGHRNASDLSNLMLTNTRIFFSLARNADRFEQMVVIGSGAIYDNRNYRPKMREESYTENLPIDDHGFSKYVIEKYLETTDNIFDLRVFGIYGRYEDYQIRFISNMVCKALFDLPLTMKQDRRFDYLYVDDLVPVLNHVLENGLPWSSMNVTPDRSVLLSEIAQLVLKIVGKPHLPVVVAEPGLGSEYSGDNSRLRSVLPGLEFTALEAGIARLVSWYSTLLPNLDREKFLVDK